MSILTTAKTFLIDKGPFITTGLVVAGVVATGVMSAKAAPNYNLAVDNAIAEKGEELTRREKAKIFVKHFGPAVAMGTLTGGLAVGTLILCKKQEKDAIGGLAAAYAVSETKIKDMVKAQKEELTKKEQDAVKTNEAESVLKRSPISEKTFMAAASAGNGAMVVKDPITNQEATCTMTDILRAEKWLSDEMAKEYRKNDVTLNQLFEQLGMDTCEAGDEYVFGYRFDEDPVSIEIVGKYDEDHERLVGILDYYPRPKHSGGYY